MTPPETAWHREHFESGERPAPPILDEIDAAHAAVRGPVQGRRAATLRLTHAYVLLLSAQFQRFCRDLHAEAYAQALSEQSIVEPLHRVLGGPHGDTFRARASPQAQEDRSWQQGVAGLRALDGSGRRHRRSRADRARRCRLLRVRFDFDDGIEPLEGDVREDHLCPPLAATG